MTPSRSPQDTIDQAVRAFGIPYGARLLVAVSGGPDSVALLDTLCRLAPEHGWALRIGHVNHGLRGAEADADERFVRDLAKIYGLDIDVERVDVGDIARRGRRSIEAAARDARYASLQAWLHRWPGDAIVTGHTRDDQAETILLQLFRGAGITGLGGMRRREELLRPFLDVDRVTVRRMLAGRALPFRDDSSNRDRRFRRNALRLDVMPAVVALDPAAPRSIARTARNLQVDAGYLSAEAQRALLAMDVRRAATSVSASRLMWRALHPALRRHALRSMLEEVIGALRDVDSHHIDVIEDAVMRGAPVENRLPHGLRIESRGPRFVMDVGRNDPPARLSPAALVVPGRVAFGPWTVEASLHRVDGDVMEAWLAVCGPYHALLDAGKAGSRLEVRSRHPGDRIHPVGMRGSRKVQDILVDRKIAAGERYTIPMVIHSDRVLWIPGIAVDREYAATSRTEHLLHLRAKPGLE